MSRRDVSVDFRKAGKMKIARMTQETFSRLPEYSASLPTGTTLGKKWRRRCSDGWYQGHFTENLPVPTCCRYHRCIAGYVDSQACHPVKHHRTGKMFDPENPKDWPEPPLQLVAIEWSKIEIIAEPVSALDVAMRRASALLTEGATREQ